MKLYWFSDKEGAEWEIFAAHNEEQAWELFVNYLNEAEDEQTLNSVKEEYELDAVTEISDAVGKVASILSHEVNFTIYGTPGGKLSKLSAT
jgi:hypothetical protein